jgi:hypothetical protein
MSLASISERSPSEEVVKFLESLLEVAKNGQLRGIAVAGILLSGEGVTGYVGIRRPYKTVGQLECLKADIIQAGHWDDGNVRIEWSNE